MNKSEYSKEGLTIIILGASGDLAKKKTYPSLFSLYEEGYLPINIIICGYSRTNLTDYDFRQHIYSYLPKKSNDTIKLNFLNICIYRSGKYDSYDDFNSVFNEIKLNYEHKWLSNHINNKINRLFYFAIPPNIFIPTSKTIYKLIKNDEENETNETVETSETKDSKHTDNMRYLIGWNRLVLEKPFGHDLNSFQILSEQISKWFDENQLYRIDHYLGKEMVQNLMILRFANTIFEPLWNRNHIKSVTITFKEDIGTFGRGGYFDSYGIIRDVMQNHLLQVLSLIAMEPPIKVSGKNYGNYVRDEKVKVLRCVEPIQLKNCILGQYIGNNNNNKEGYLDDKTVSKNSITPTYACCILYIKNHRWDGVPFILKAGKALNEKKGEIRIQYHRPPGMDLMFQDIPLQDIPVNDLVIRLQPNEAVYMKTNVKSPGLTSFPVASELDLSYNTRYKDHTLPDAYTRLLLDVLNGNESVFVRNDELKVAWEIFTPLLEEIKDKNIKPILYEFGTRGPPEADELAINAGFEYHKGKYEWKNK